MRLIPLLLLSGIVQVLPAATLEGSFSFEQPPRVALVYMSEDHSLTTSEAVFVDQKDKDFTSVLVIAPPGGTVNFRNSDDVQHNVFAEDKETGVTFDIGLANPQSVTPQAVSWKDGQVVRCGCKIHPKMQMWVAAIDSRYHQAVTFTPGSKEAVPFTVPGVPATCKMVRVWTPRFDPLEVEVKVGAPLVVNVTRKDKVFGTLTLTLK